jgi:hypothetical protein
MKEYDMVLNDPALLSSIEAIGEHYRANISNRFTQHALDSMSFDPSELKRVQDLFEKSENYRYQGFHLDELYMQILVAARFVSCARSQVLPMLRMESMRNGGHQGTQAQDRILREMAVNNFAPNLNILADKIGDLYSLAVALDKEAAGQEKPVFARLPELGDLGRYLSGSD